MVKLFVFVFLVVNGVQRDDPASTYSHTSTFNTVEACEAFLKSDDNATDFQGLKDAVIEENPDLTFAFDEQCLTIPAPESE